MSQFDWDPERARINAAKHGVTFDEAMTVEQDPNRWSRADDRRDLDDERMITIGYSTEGSLLYVVTSERGHPSRIISARRATKRERHAYETRS